MKLFLSIVVLVLGVVCSTSQFVPILPNTLVAGVVVDAHGRRFLAGTSSEEARDLQGNTGSLSVARCFAVDTSGVIDTLMTYVDGSGPFDPLSSQQYEAIRLLSAHDDSVVMIATGGDDANFYAEVATFSPENRWQLRRMTIGGHGQRFQGYPVSMTPDGELMCRDDDAVLRQWLNSYDTIATTGDSILDAEVGSILFYAREQQSIYILGSDGVITPVDAPALAVRRVTFDETLGSLVGWTAERVAWSNDSGRSWTVSQPVDLRDGEIITAAHRSPTGLIAYATFGQDSAVTICIGDEHSTAWERHAVPRYMIIGTLRGARKAWLTAVTSTEMRWYQYQPYYYGAFRWATPLSVAMDEPSHVPSKVLIRGVDCVDRTGEGMVEVYTITGAYVGVCDPTLPVALPSGVYSIDRHVILVMP